MTPADRARNVGDAVVMAEGGAHSDDHLAGSMGAMFQSVGSCGSRTHTPVPSEWTLRRVVEQREEALHSADRLMRLRPTETRGSGHRFVDLWAVL